MMNLISKLFLMFWMFMSSGDMSPEFYFSSWEASGADGMMFPLDDANCLTFSKGEAAALHELGHCVDFWGDYPSQSPEFEEVVIGYLETCEENPCWRIGYFYDQGMLDEVYAIFYMWDILYTIPPEFEEFYAR